MKKKLFSTVLIVVLISFTVAPLWGYSCISYAVEESTTATDQQKQDAAFASYLNFRGGYFVSQSGGAVSALSIMRNYIDEFYISSSNNTGIRSTSDFISHVSFVDSSGHWSVRIDNTGLLFLDNLIKYLLGKDEFPDLYSGGSWGSGPDTNDNVYDGYLYGNSLFCHVYGNFSGSGNNLQGECTSVKLGSAWSGLTADYLKNEYERLNNLSINFSEYNSSLSYGSSKTISFTLPLESGTTTASPSLSCNTTSGQSSYRPVLLFGSTTGFPYGFVYGDRTNVVRGFFCLAVIHSASNAPSYASGVLTYNATLETYYFKTYRSYSRLINDADPASVDFDTIEFDRSDIGSESENAPAVEFTPKYEGDNNTYNYYNYNEYNENTFIDEYIKKYVVKKTIIDGSNQDSGENPGGGGGGSVTPGNGSGSITPDGNGGYNFNLPDIGWPDFSGFDFNISGLSQKFPFSIPFDLMAFFTVLNAEPETPEIQGQIDLGIVQWDIDWNLEDFDGLAALLRNLEFIGFCLALILITRSIIKG